MKRICSLILSFCLLLGLCACGGNQAETDALTWQEQYDLGVKYLSEGNYEEAIIAFELAIQIDPKLPDAYLKAAEAYEGAGNIDKAMEILDQGYEATGAESLEEYRNTLELWQNPWPALTAEQQELFRSLAAAARNFDQAAAQTIVTSEEYFYFYEEFPLTRHWENDDNTGGGWLGLTTDAGQIYRFSYWSDPENNGELDFWFDVMEDDGYYRVSYWTPYMSETRNGSYAIGYWTGEQDNETGPFRQVSWSNYGQWHMMEGTALNGIRVGAETRTSGGESIETTSYVVEFDQEGNLIYQQEQVNESGDVEYVQSNGNIHVIDPDHYPMQATTVTN